MIKIICVGKIKEKFYTEAINEYLKRLKKYTKIEIIEVNDESNNSIEIIKKQEKKSIINNFKEKDFVVTLEIEGNQLSSIELSKKIEDWQMINSNITFIIGGSYGLDKEIKERSNYSLSFSKFTFPHQLFRIILLEQIYRSYKIIANESYHK